MTHDEAKRAFFAGTPVVHDGIFYSRIEALIYKHAENFYVKPNIVVMSGGSVFAISAELHCSAGQCVMVVPVDKIKSESA
jgi:hypothetical protein